MNTEQWIRELIQQGKEYKFYKSRSWLDLRESVLEQFHYECQECCKQGKYKRAETVHHINEVKKRPDLALSEYYIDSMTGEKKRNLIPLCNDCHNKAHERMGYKKPKPQLNVERW